MRITSATVRTKTANTGVPFPTTGITRTPSLVVTAPQSMAGTIYIYTTGTKAATTPTRAVGDRGNSMIPLTAGQSFTFGGMTRGAGSDRDLTFGTGYTYIFGDATSRRATLTWFTWD